MGLARVSAGHTVIHSTVTTPRSTLTAIVGRWILFSALVPALWAQAPAITAPVVPTTTTTIHVPKKSDDVIATINELLVEMDKGEQLEVLNAAIAVRSRRAIAA